MAVDIEKKTPASSPRRMLVGTNVAITIVLAVAVVVVLQGLSYLQPARWDMTSSRINSLSDGTESLLRSLDQKVYLTSLYFQTDREDEDQSRYRDAIDNLLQLYQTTNRSNVSAQWINPLDKNRSDLSAIYARLRAKPAFKDQVEAYQAAIDTYQDELAAKMLELVQRELEQAGVLGSSLTGSGTPQGVAAISQVFTQWIPELEATREQVDALIGIDMPQYAAAINELKSHYARLSKTLTDIAKYAQAELARTPDMAPEAASFLSNAGGRYALLVADIEAQTTRLRALEPLDLDDLLRDLDPLSNPILVETDQDAKVIAFDAVWPALTQSGPQAPFQKRAFKGEEQLTSAILRATHKEQTAVIFVRYGGPPLLMGSMMPQMPRGPYVQMKQQLEAANFVVREWDLQVDDTMPVIEPPPTRTIFIVLKPTPPPSGPMGQRGPDPPFGESHRQAFLSAMGESGRALFIAGWTPGPFGPVPSTYEYGHYLTSEWGITVDTSVLLIETVNVDAARGRYNVQRQDFWNMGDLSFEESHPIVTGLFAKPLALPWCAPLELTETAPDGVQRSTLITQPIRDGVWGIKNIQTYQQQASDQQYLTKAEGDLEGPFMLGAVATKGDAKIVVISSRAFAEDNFALARGLIPTAQGFALIARNPGNATLLLNSLHWLGDNTEFMNIGQQIDLAVLHIESPGTVTAVKVLIIAVWPALVLLCGIGAWWIRRR